VKLLQETGFFKRHLDSKLSYKDFLSLLANYITVNKFERGDTILLEGSPPEAYHLILEGEVIKYASKPLKELEKESEEMAKN